VNRVLGWLLLLPAVGLGIWQVLVPAGRTAWLSVFRVDLLGGPVDGQVQQYIGLEAYAGAELGGPVLLGLVVGLPAFLAAALVGAAIGGLAATAAEGPRLAVRGVLGVLVVLYAPIGIGLALRLVWRTGLGLSFLVLVLVLVTLPIGAALVALGVMAAAGPDGTGSRAGRRFGSVALVVGLGLVIALALGLQTFGLPAAVTGMSRESVLPGGLVYERGFQYFDLSAAAAVSTVLLVILGVLGLLVTVLLLAVGARVELTPPRYRARADASGPAPGTGTGPTAGGAVAVVLALLVLVAFLVLAREWVAGLFAPLPASLSFDEAMRIGINTWVPPLLAVLAQVLVGALAGVGIGWLRPAGRRSEWLLLLFAPGLFVTLTPLLIAKFMAATEAGTFGERSVLPPLLVSIPLVYLFTFVAAGLRRGWDRDPARRGRVVVTGVAVITVTVVVLWVVQAQSITWNLISATDPDRANGPLTLVRLASALAGDGIPQQLATPIPLLAVLAAVAAVGISGLDRLRIRVGKPSHVP
jgi:ABC-type sugar transport system permease subunit